MANDKDVSDPAKGEEPLFRIEVKKAGLPQRDVQDGDVDYPWTAYIYKVPDETLPHTERGNTHDEVLERAKQWCRVEAEKMETQKELNRAYYFYPSDDVLRPINPEHSQKP